MKFEDARQSGPDIRREGEMSDGRFEMRAASVKYRELLQKKMRGL
jgi:hypothetical protein